MTEERTEPDPAEGGTPVPSGAHAMFHTTEQSSWSGDDGKTKEGATNLETDYLRQRQAGLWRDH